MWEWINTLLIILVTLLQVVLHRRPQTARVRALEARLAEVEYRLELLHTQLH